MMNTQTIDTERIKQDVDLRELAATYTTLRRESTKELAGPCPKCGGDDRFRVRVEWFFCRQCHPKRADAIEFITWVHGVPFKEAAAMLQGQALPAPAAPRKPEAKRTMAREWNAAEAERALLQYQRALWDSANVKAHEYLLDKRGLDAHTWATFGLVYRHDTPLPGTWNGSTRSYSHPPQPAIAIPWYRGKQLVAIRYRFLAAHTYIDASGNERTEKQTAAKNSQFTGHLFGGQAMTYFPPAAGRPDVLQQRTLVICEGEINCMSIWQVANETRLDVLSLGSESQHLTTAQVEHAQRYKAVVLWADREEIAEQLQEVIPSAYVVSSARCLGQDANDLLQAGKLGLYLSTWRFDAAKDREAQAALLFDLLEVMRAWHRVDDGTKQVAQWMAEQLQIQVEVTSDGLAPG